MCIYWCGIGPVRPSARIMPPMKLVSRDLWRGGSPPSPPGYCHVTGPRDHVTGHVIARPVSTVPPPPSWPVYGGEGSPWAPPYVMARAPSLWRRIGYKGPLPTHTHKLHCQGLGRLCSIGCTCPQQLSLLAVFYALCRCFQRRFNAAGERVTILHIQVLNSYAGYAFSFWISFEFYKNARGPFSSFEQCPYMLLNLFKNHLRLHLTF